MIIPLWIDASLALKNRTWLKNFKKRKEKAVQNQKQQNENKSCSQSEAKNWE